MCRETLLLLCDSKWHLSLHTRVVFSEHMTLSRCCSSEQRIPRSWQPNLMSFTRFKGKMLTGVSVNMASKFLAGH